MGLVVAALSMLCVDDQSLLSACGVHTLNTPFCCREVLSPSPPAVPQQGQQGPYSLASRTNDAENTKLQLWILRTFNPDSPEALSRNLGSQGCSSFWLPPASVQGWRPHLSFWAMVLCGSSSLDGLDGQDSF